MFDLITGRVRHIPGGGTGPVLVSTGLHVLLLGAVVSVPLLLMKDMLPEVPTMMAFVASVPAPPPPPPPPPPPAVKSAEPPRTQAPPSANAVPIPLDAPTKVMPESAGGNEDVGVPGGVEGGVPGGVAGGVVGGIPEEAPPPPPPPPPPAPRGPVRIGGQIQQPTLVSRVEPVYPPLAVAAHVQGVVILEATVNPEGLVRDVKILRSIPLLDKAAVDAVRQWRYSPVILNGTPVPFILTVVVQFSVPTGKGTASY